MLNVNSNCFTDSDGRKEDGLAESLLGIGGLGVSVETQFQVQNHGQYGCQIVINGSSQP